MGAHSGNGTSGFPIYGLALGSNALLYNQSITVGSPGGAGGIGIDTGFYFINRNHAIGHVDSIASQLAQTTVDSFVSYTPLFQSVHSFSGSLTVTANAGANVLSVIVTYYDQNGVYRTATLPLLNTAGVFATIVTANDVYTFTLPSIWSINKKLNAYVSITTVSGTPTYDVEGHFQFVAQKQ